jgi:hypothetical protein
VQAGPDAVNVRNLGAAQAKRVACTRLLPFGRVGLCCRRQHQDRKRRCQHQTELEIPGPGGNHESPQAFIRELWVKDGGLARTRDIDVEIVAQSIISPKGIGHFPIAFSPQCENLLGLAPIDTLFNPQQGRQPRDLSGYAPGLVL